MSLSPELEQSLAGKCVALGVGGSISAYKAADLCSKLVQAGARVLPILTRGALRFVAPATFWGLAGEPVATESFELPFGAKEIAHLHYAEVCDCYVVAPAPADLLARMAGGVCDDMLTSALIANIHRPVLVAPAMNTDMWAHPATRRNRQILEGYGYRFIEPGVGRLAEGVVGAGRLAEPDEILQAIRAALAPSDLAGLRVLVTAGATREPIDPVRFLSNRSSGKMGYAIAEAAARRGADVVLVSGITALPAPFGVHEVIITPTTDEMWRVCERIAPTCAVVVAAAAVADYTPAQVSAQKIKKGGMADWSLALRPTVDILRQLGERKTDGQILVGFAAETDDLLAHAAAKLSLKNLDLVVANDVTQPGAGFDTDTNIVTFVEPGGETNALPQMHKSKVADKLCDWIAAHRTAPASTEPNKKE